MSGVDALLRTHTLLTIAFCLPALAGVSPIGMATSDGDIEIGRVRMPGPATLYDGATVETGSTPAQLSLRNGAVILLGSGAKATIHTNSLFLERGVGQIDAPGEYAISARSVTLIPTSHPARARLRLSDDGTLQVAALSGAFELHRAGVSSIVVAGRSLSFAADTADAGAVAPLQFKGCLAKSTKGYLLRDDSSKAIVALIGGSITAKSGDRVTVVGNASSQPAPVKGATQVIDVLRLTVDGHGCQAKAVLAAAGVAGAAGAAIGGMSATTVAIAGAAATSAVLVPTIALTRSSESASSSSTSTSTSTSSSISPSSR